MTRRLVLLCHANIARSAAGEVLARRLIGDSSPWTVCSRGTNALVGHAIDRDIAAALHRRGVGTWGHRAAQATATDLRDADLVLAFESAQRVWAIAAAPSAVRSVFTIRRAARVIAAHGADALAADHAEYTADDDFDDPYGRGPEVADTAVAEIDALLRVILPGIGAARARRIPPPAAPQPTRRSMAEARL